MRLNKKPSGGSESFDVTNGGVLGLAFISEDKIDQKSHAVRSDLSNLIPRKFINISEVAYLPMLKGKSTVLVNEPEQWTITNYNLSQDYTPSSQYGDITVEYDVVRFTSNVAGTVSFNLAGRLFTFESLRRYIETPWILNGSSPLTVPSVTLTSSDFIVRNTEDTHQATDWEISLESNFASVYRDLRFTTTDLLSWSVNNLLPKTNYYVRLRYYGFNTQEPSEWSPGFLLQTAMTAKITTPQLVAPGLNETQIALRPSLQSTDFHVTDWVDTHATSDWQLSKSSSFSDVDFFTYNDRDNQTTWNPGRLDVNTIYYARLRHKGNQLGWSDWSSVATFKTLNLVAEKPLITYPLMGTQDLPYAFTVKSTNFASVGDLEHMTTDWEIATDAGFNNVIRRLDQSTTQKTAWPVELLPAGTNLYFRVRHNSDDGIISQWSETVTAKTQALKVFTPVITSPLNNATDLDLIFTVTGSVFVANNAAEHKDSDWQIATDSNFVGIFAQSLASQDKTSWTTPKLIANVDYFIRVRYRSVDNTVSSWSIPIAIKTKQMLVNKPSVLKPLLNQNNYDLWLNAVSSNFSELGQVDHVSSSWQLAPNLSFTTDLIENLNSTTDKTTWNIKLKPNTTYYLRVRHEGMDNVISLWSDAVSFITKSWEVYQPQLLSPLDGETETSFTPLFTATPYGANDTIPHDSTDWQISTDAGFTDIFYQLEASVSNKTSFTPPALPHSTQFHARVRYRSGNTVSLWSNSVIFTTLLWYVNTPTINSVDKETSDLTPTFFGSSFSFNGVLVHNASDWQIATDIDFTNIVSENLNSPSLESWSASGLERNTTYYVRVRYKTEQGVNSLWSNPVTYITDIPRVSVPSITAPTAYQLDVDLLTTISASVFESNYSSIHATSDWEISTNASFTGIVFSAYDSLFKTSIDTGILPYNVALYVRVRYKDDSGLVSGWSETSVFRTKYFTVDKPTITDPVDETMLTVFNITATCTPYVSSEGVDYVQTEWQLSSVANPDVVLNSNTTSATDYQWSLSGLSANTQFLIKVRFIGLPATSETPLASEWSDPVKFTTPVKRVDKPFILTPANNQENVAITPSITSSAFQSNSSLSHALTEWQAASDANFNSIVYAFNNNNQETLLSWPIPFGAVESLDVNTIYYIRVRYRSTDSIYSPWSDVIKFKTID